MTRRQAVVGAILSLIFPSLVYVILYVIVALKNRAEQDFAYHDSYFLVMHVGWGGYLTCAVLAMLLFTIVVWGYWFVRKLIK
ncbi:hypothetical protein [Paenibacillus sp. CF384]|uniref:hypothetical protein n=1 Tax=Paenibacillus sp. CF384 TaxID=1884382 RepID=UPI000895CAC3|nr:hypothetical protein [Paenibacillus sp. CF384]SDW68026.1 hypothetical protein SAMN05518855_1004116 [Paenibacillus sp. CF384]